PAFKNFRPLKRGPILTEIGKGTLEVRVTPRRTRGAPFLGRGDGRRGSSLPRSAGGAEKRYDRGNRNCHCGKRSMSHRVLLGTLLINCLRSYISVGCMSNLRRAERLALGGEMLFESIGAVTVVTGPALRAVRVTTATPGMRVLNLQQIEIPFPVGAFFSQWRVAVTDFNPLNAS